MNVDYRILSLSSRDLSAIESDLDEGNYQRQHLESQRCPAIENAYAV